MNDAAFPDFGRALRLLNANWVIVVPGLVVGVVSGLLEALIAPRPDATVAGGFVALLLTVVVDVVAAILSIAYTTGMAEAAWTRGTTSFADGRNALAREGRHVLVAMLGLVVLGLAASFLAPFTVGISLAVYGFFCIYALPAAVVGEKRGFAAIAESAEIAYRRPLQTLVTIVAIAAVAFGMGFLASLLAFAPLVGPIVFKVVVQVAIAYIALVVVGEYVALHGKLPAA